jgi:predicted ATP-grasp superfamily ATP-dependent carboligase
MYTGALENYPDLVDELAWIAPLWGNPGDVLERVRSPWELAEVLGAADLAYPELRPSPDGLPRDGSWLAKAVNGSSGSGVSEVGTGGNKTGGDEVVYQRRIEGLSCSAVYVAYGDGAEFFGASRQLVGERWLGAGKFQYAGSISPLPAAAATLAEMARIGDVIARRFSLIGLFGVDMVLDERGQVWTIEVNPRFTASIEVVERAAGVNVVAAHAAACAGMPFEPPQPADPARRYHGKAILFAKRAVTISERFAEWALEDSLAAPGQRLADISPGGTKAAAGGAVLTAFAAGDSPSVVESRLRARVAEVEARLYAG